MDLKTYCYKFVEDVLDQAVFAIGCGAEMPVKRAALVELRDLFRVGFREVICAPEDPIDPSVPTAPGQERWDKYKNHILNLCVGLGRLARAKAINNAQITIRAQELFEAYDAFSRTPDPGRFCIPRP